MRMHRPTGHSNPLRHRSSVKDYGGKQHFGWEPHEASLDWLPCSAWRKRIPVRTFAHMWRLRFRSEEHTSELQSQSNLVCRLLLEKKKKTNIKNTRLKISLLMFTLTSCVNFIISIHSCIRSSVPTAVSASTLRFLTFSIDDPISIS